MLLAIDIGNSSISCALMRGPRIKSRWRIPVAGALSYRRVGPQLLRRIGKKQARLIQGICMVSVVPGLNSLFRRACQQSLGLRPLLATPQTIGIPIPAYNRRQVGPDRLVVARAAHARFRRPLIVVDVGSAITVDCVSKRGQFLGGAILPGIEMAASALHQMAARLPRVRIRPPARTVGRSTPEAIRTGVIYGIAGALERLIREMRREMGGRPLVIATGGDAELMARACSDIQHLCPDLIFEGLRLVWERNR
jgi:type III pantothenate kinase